MEFGEDKNKLVGNLLKYKNIKKEDIDLFLILLFNNKYKLLAPLRDIIDDDFKFLEILDLFAGSRIWFPERLRSYRNLERATTYNYLKERGFSPEAYKSAAKQIDKRIIQTRSLMETIDTTLSLEKDIKASMRLVQKELETRKKLDPLESYNFDFTEGEDDNA